MIDLKFSDEFEDIYKDQLNIFSESLDELEINCEIIEKSIQSI